MVKWEGKRELEGIPNTGGKSDRIEFSVLPKKGRGEGKGSSK